MTVAGLVGALLLEPGGRGLTTRPAPAAERTIHLKLPVEGARFHWRFADGEALLAGELTLRIANAERDDTLVVFRDGRMMPGWRMTDDPGRDGSVYFGFATGDRHPTAPGDSLVLRLVAPEDLPGRGPYREGVLSAGTWEVTGTYSGLYGGGRNPLHRLFAGDREPVAFLECWDGQWPLRVTRNQGWSGRRSAEEKEAWLLEEAPPERGVDGRHCRSHTHPSRARTLSRADMPGAGREVQ